MRTEEHLARLNGFIQRMGPDKATEEYLRKVDTSLDPLSVFFFDASGHDNLHMEWGGHKPGVPNSPRFIVSFEYFQ